MKDSSESRLARAYYHVKPFLPRGLRWLLRRQRAQGIRKRHQDVWPINPLAGAAPEGWPGWPDGKRFAVVLTHDVEGQAGLDKVRSLAEIDRAAGLRSSFNFIPAGDYSVPEDLRKWLGSGGFEVGVHDLHHNGKLYHSRRLFQRHAAEINRYLSEWQAAGFRSGFMLRQLDWLHELNIEYDASTFDTDPFEPQPGGCRTIFPFVIKDAASPDSAGYVELPYTLPQDSTLYLLLGETTADIWIRKLDWIAERGGMALVNIHPDYVSFNEDHADRFKYPVSRIETLLRHLNQRYEGEFWNPLPRELARWFRSTRCATGGSAETRSPVIAKSKS